MDIITPLQWRYAVKKFDPNKKVPQHIVDELLDGLRLTPSSFGLQLWNFLVIENQQKKQDLVSMSFNQNQVADCSHLIVFCTPKSIDNQCVDEYIQDIAQTRKSDISSLDGFAKVMKDFIARKDEPARHKWMDNQLYIALGSFLTLCALKAVDACPMEGIITTKYDRYLELDKLNLRSVVACPIGYRDSADKYAMEAKVRYPRSKVIQRFI